MAELIERDAQDLAYLEAVGAGVLFTDSMGMNIPVAFATMLAGLIRSMGKCSTWIEASPTLTASHLVSVPPSFPGMLPCKLLFRFPHCISNVVILTSVPG
jgi:hypothetical protein